MPWTIPDFMNVANLFFYLFVPSKYSSFFATILESQLYCVRVIDWLSVEDLMVARLIEKAQNQSINKLLKLIGPRKRDVF